MPADVTLYTIGYEKRSLDEFIAILRGHGVTLLIDVRDVAWSHKPGFSKQPLLAGLAKAGIRYHHAKFAGNPKSLRRGASGLPEMLDRYRTHLDANPQIVEVFAELVAAAAGERLTPAIMCFERAPADCHRTILAGRWRALTGGEVVALQ